MIQVHKDMKSYIKSDKKQKPSDISKLNPRTLGLFIFPMREIMKHLRSTYIHACDMYRTDGRGRRHGGFGRAEIREAQVAKGGRQEHRGLRRVRVGLLLGVDGDDTVVPLVRHAAGEEVNRCCRVQQESQSAALHTGGRRGAAVG